VHSLILWQEGHFTREIKNLEEEEGEQEEECNIQGGPKKYAHTKWSKVVWNHIKAYQID